MKISDETLFTKMLKEIEAARVNKENVNYHISRVKLLCELILENESPIPNDIHNKTNDQEDAKEVNHSVNRKKVDADPYSIFDF